MLEVSLVSLFLAGLLGGVHCAGMCGGIVGAITFHLPADKPRWPFLLAYNLARLFSYTLAGALAGGLGSAARLTSHLLPVSMALYLLASLLLIGMGLYLAGFSAAITRLEKLGGRLWRRLNPVLTRLLPVRNLGQAWVVGMLWGWLPCGLVYTALVSALATGSITGGSSVMLAFGLGTLPNLLAMGFAAQKLLGLARQRSIRLIAGLLVAGFGVMGILKALAVLLA